MTKHQQIAAAHNAFAAAVKHTTKCARLEQATKDAYYRANAAHWNARNQEAAARRNLTKTLR